MNNRRIGNFSISKEMIDNYPEEVVKIFHELKIVVTRAEYIYPFEIRYTGISPHFQEVKPSEKARDYQIITENIKDPNSYEEWVSYRVKEL